MRKLQKSEMATTEGGIPLFLLFFLGLFARYFGGGRFRRNKTGGEKNKVPGGK